MTAAANPGSPGAEPAAAPGPGAAPAPFVQTLLSIVHELPGLLSDRVDLLALELTRVGKALAQIVLMLVAVAVLGVTVWLVIWGAVVMGLLALGLPWGWVLLILLLVNLGSIGWLLTRMRTLLPKLTLPATRRHLTLSPSAEPHPTEPDLRHDRHDFSPAGQPAAR